MKNEAATREAIDHFQTLPTFVLSAIVRGDVDAVALAARELSARGQANNGRWVGFDEAAELHAEKINRMPGLAGVVVS